MSVNDTENPINGVHFKSANATLPDWRNGPEIDDPDDDEMPETPPDVISILGFDPKDGDDGKNMSRGFSRGPYGFSAGSKGRVMANLSDDQAGPILDYLKTIDVRDLAEDGLETEPHITALYGLTSDSQGPVVTVCREFGPIRATLGKIEAFSNPDYDVLKITVDSSELVKVNEALKKLPHENDFPTYRPHLTLAYLKPGTAEKYVGSDIFSGTALIFDSLVFSDSQKNRRTIQLGQNDTLGEIECMLLNAKDKLSSL